MVASERTSAPVGRIAGGAWLVANLQAERERWVLWTPVAVGVGIAAYFSMPLEPPNWVGGVLVALALFLTLCLRFSQALLMLAIGSCLVAAGFAAAQLQTGRVAAPIVEKRLPPATVTGQIRQIEIREGGPRAVLQALEVSGLPADRVPARVRLRLTAGNPDRLGPGDWLRTRAVLQPPPAPSAPGAFDFGRRAYFQRIGAVGFTLGPVRRADGPPRPAAGILERWWSDWQLWWSDLRRLIGARILAALPGREGALAAALMTGDRSALPRSLVDAMRASGLAHLLAISGLHMGLVTGLVFGACRALLALYPSLALSMPIKKWAALAGWLAGFAYLMLAGGTVPTQRAFLMVSLVLLAVMVDRVAISLRLVCWAALAVLLIAPDVLLSASFQMSFAAVVALVAGYEVMVWHRRGQVGARSLPVRLAVYFAGVAVTSIIAILATGFFAAFHFNAVAVYGLLANLVAVPATALWVMPWALIAFALMPFGGEALALVPMAWGLEVVIAAAEWVAALPQAVLWVRAMPDLALGLFVFGGLWLCLWRRPWRLLGLPLCLAAIATLALSPPPDLLVTGNGKLQAILHGDGRLWLSSARVERYAADVWRRRAGLGATEIGPWPKDRPGLSRDLRCDALGCLYRRDGTVVALVGDGRALSEDCAVARVLISLEPLRGRPCKGPEVVIDRFDLWRDGAHALWLEPDRVRVESVRSRRGTRPWSP